MLRALASGLHAGPVGAGYEPSSGDVMLVSYPRSGNTWLRLVLANLSAPGTADFLTLERYVPDIYVSSDRHIRSLSEPRLVKSHQPLTPSYQRVLYLVRDPRDVAASYLRYLQRVGELSPATTLPEFAGPFLRGEIRDGFGSWRAHVEGWLTRTPGQDFLLVRYRDAVADPTRWVPRIAEFCGIPCPPDRLRSALEAASADRMRALERTQAHRSRSLGRRRSGIPFVGPARYGAGRDAMDPSTRAAFDAALGDLIDRLGYDRDR